VCFAAVVSVHQSSSDWSMVLAFGHVIVGRHGDGYISIMEFKNQPMRVYFRVLCLGLPKLSQVGNCTTNLGSLSLIRGEVLVSSFPTFKAFVSPPPITTLC